MTTKIWKLADAVGQLDMHLGNAGHAMTYHPVLISENPQKYLQQNLRNLDSYEKRGKPLQYLADVAVKSLSPAPKEVVWERFSSEEKEQLRLLAKMFNIEFIEGKVNA